MTIRLCWPFVAKILTVSCIPFSFTILRRWSWPTPLTLKVLLSRLSKLSKMLMVLCIVALITTTETHISYCLTKTRSLMTLTLIDSTNSLLSPCLYQDNITLLRFHASWRTDKYSTCSFAERQWFIIILCMILITSLLYKKKLHIQSQIVPRRTFQLRCFMIHSNHSIRKMMETTPRQVL